MMTSQISDTNKNYLIEKVKEWALMKLFDKIISQKSQV